MVIYSCLTKKIETFLKDTLRDMTLAVKMFILDVNFSQTNRFQIQYEDMQNSYRMIGIQCFTALNWCQKY